VKIISFLYESKSVKISFKVLEFGFYLFIPLLFAF